MGKMKALAIEMMEQSVEQSVEQNEQEEMMEESHYWMLVDNVAQWVIDNKSTLIIDDITHKVRNLYINGSHSNGGKK